jgi:mercuric ion transport protein
MSRVTKTGLIGAIIAAICCFTPLLVWVLAAIGLSSLVIYLDAVLLPLLGVFIAMALYGFVKQGRA